jgi:hypothetical protein
VRGFGFGVRDTVFRALGCTGLLCLFFGPNVESLPAYSVHVGDRSADPCQYCRSPIRQLQPAQCSIVSRKFRRAGSGITGQVNRCEGLGLGYGTQYFEHSVAPVCYACFLDRVLNPCQRTPFTWVTARQTPAYIVFNQSAVATSPVFNSQPQVSSRWEWHNGKRCEGLGLGYGTQYFEHSVAPVCYACFLDRVLNPCQRTPFTWVTARQTPAYIVFNPIGSCNQPSVQQSAASFVALGVA